MDPMGGLRDISTLSGRPTRPLSSAFSEHEEDMRDVDFVTRSNAALLEEGDYTSSEEGGVPKKGRRMGHTRNSSTIYDRSVSNKINPIPIGEQPRPEGKIRMMIRKFKRSPEKPLSRARVVFRAFSLIASGAVLGAIAHMLWHYIDTRGEFHHGKLIWPENLTIMPTALMLAIAIYTFLTDLGFLIGSAWTNFRYLRNKVAAVLVALNSLTSCIGWIVSILFSLQQQDRPTLLWVCSVKKAPHSADESEGSPMDFSLHCSELNFTWIAACVVAAAQGLVVFTIVFSCCGGRPKKPKFKAPKDVRPAGRWSSFT
ncbi:hypothetical protein L873DRAFT_1913226 [Choiromyces venosus 120613-1]|uniref:Uncharacterized protein n=1 Tax=Choiromyces venosus 120613-1 TaxID=1336337 RepID=A0A3N4JNJ1_9PEZI|nr:hypothetical protein L873DRAFT_1913226 [Choiromyces venosus 120613-1]